MPRSPRQDDERYGSRSREYDDYKADGGGRRKDRGGADEDDRRSRDERRSAREHEDDYDRRDDRRRRRVYDDDEDEEEERRRRKRRERERERDGEGSKRRRFRSPEGGDYASRRGEGSSRRHEEERRRDDGRRSREPPQGGDGGWGPRAEGSSNARAVVRGASPGRPSRALPSQQDALRAQNGEQGGEVAERPAAVKVEPNFKNSGMLAAETNTFKGVVLKYNEPPEARKPLKPWRLYVFKGKEQVDLHHVHRQSAFLFGRDRVVSDIPIEHPSASKQHAVLQFRQLTERNEFGDTSTKTKPFIIDLESANGTTVNGDKVPASRYYELRNGDVLKFAFSSREYVLLVEQ